MNKTYRVEYKEHSAADVKGIDVLAANKAEAYDRAVYEKLAEVPYSAWVASVTYNNGSYRRFNSFEGKPY